jgi:polyhydroxyalkanoate synthesis regulator phasin
MGTQENISKGFQVAEKSMEKYWDMWLLAMGSFSWTQEQMESAVHKYLSQRKVEQEEALKISEELLQQVKKNQQYFQYLIRDAVVAAVENANIPNFGFIADLNKRVEDLRKKVEEK